MKKRKFKPVFIMNRRNGHPAFVFDIIGNEYEYIGITHAKITSGRKNIKLYKNPNPADSRKSYMRPFADTDEIRWFKKTKIKNYCLNKCDKKKVREIKKRLKIKKHDIET